MRKLLLVIAVALTAFQAIAADSILRPDHPETYRVQEGDTLWDIAKLYDGITVDHLKLLNSGLDDRLQLGQKIKIKKIS